MTASDSIDAACLPRRPETAGVQLLRGDPKRAIIHLSLPMIAAMLLQSSYNVVNAIWVAGLGSDAMAAIGFVTPVFMILMGLGNGIGAGATSAIARRIGACDRKGANNAAVHGLLLAVGLAAILTFPLILFAEPLLTLFGAGATAPLAATYARVIFGGTVLLLFVNIGYAVLRAEGDAKRAMYAMVASALLNIVLDPILIYWFGLGITGAAWGVLISMSMVTAILLYWFFVRRDTFLSLGWEDFHPDRRLIGDMLHVGLPASLEFGLMSALSITVNWMLVATAGTDAVASYTAGWRVVMFAIIPVAAIGTSVVSVAGASYGARRYDKLRTAHQFGVGLGMGIGIALSAVVYVFAHQIAWIFAYSPQSAHLAPIIAAFLATMCFFFPFVAPGMISSSVFQGTGKGFYSLVMSLIRSLVFCAFFAYVFAFVLDMGESGVWWGIVTGNTLGGIVGFLWARFYVMRLIRLSGPRPPDLAFGVTPGPAEAAADEPRGAGDR
ncbi:MAG: MATE family efflux transporter [Methanospirillum sp.]|nr:MATE family efflux transporter [Methanospirillum sp.]